MQRLDLDYCTGCDLPTFDHEQVALVKGEFMHLHCLQGSVWVAKKQDLRAPPVE